MTEKYNAGHIPELAAAAIKRELQLKPFFANQLQKLEFRSVVWSDTHMDRFWSFHIVMKEKVRHFGAEIHAIVEYEAYREECCFIVACWPLNGGRQGVYTWSNVCAQLNQKQIQFNDYYYAQQKDLADRIARSKKLHEDALKRLGSEEAVEAETRAFLDRLAKLTEDDDVTD